MARRSFERFSLDRPRVMGIVNVTPDSFSDGGRFDTVEGAVTHGLALATAGAHILDIGGESTRPGSSPVAPAEQLARVLPVIQGLRQLSDIAISVDTTSAEVAEQALDVGADIVNDVSAGRDDPQMLPLVARRRAPIVLMHMRGTPRTMQRDVHYDDVVAEVSEFLLERVEMARAAGVPNDHIILDPGIGFGKNLEHNLTLLRETRRLTDLGYPLLVGPSRKAFVGALTGRGVEDREFGTAAAVSAAILGGASIVRIHDVDRMIDVVRVASAIGFGAS